MMIVSDGIPYDNLVLVDPHGEWRGKPAFIIGGGSSLKGFDFSLLKGRNTIGVNDAFRLGEEIVKICLFGDSSWFHKTKWELEKFKGRVVSAATSLHALSLPWLVRLGRIRDGLGDGRCIGWNYSTGAAAISLAYHLGAPRIILLGFDMGLVNTKSHWHNHRSKVTAESSFVRHMRGMETLGRDLRKHPEVDVVNVTDVSRITCFRKVPMSQFASMLD